MMQIKQLLMTKDLYMEYARYDLKAITNSWSQLARNLFEVALANL